MRLILITLSLIFSAHAVELSQASNGQILRELSKRLGNGNGTPDLAFLNAFCSGDDINLQLETLNSTQNKVIDLRTSLECKNAVNLIKKGQFNGLLITAFCDSDLMYKVKASSSGVLNITSIDHRTSIECNESARSINRQ
jgi:hypothetical protein